MGPSVKSGNSLPMNLDMCKDKQEKQSISDYPSIGKFRFNAEIENKGQEYMEKDGNNKEDIICWDPVQLQVCLLSQGLVASHMMLTEVQAMKEKWGFFIRCGKTGFPPLIKIPQRSSSSPISRPSSSRISRTQILC